MILYATERKLKYIFSTYCIRKNDNENINSGWNNCLKTRLISSEIIIYLKKFTFLYFWLPSAPNTWIVMLFKELWWESQILSPLYQELLYQSLLDSSPKQMYVCLVIIISIISLEYLLQQACSAGYPMGHSNPCPKPCWQGLYEQELQS